ncbi:MAG: tetratricopeptide repeat protein [Bacteroidota bacterium]|nr:tetratricopeptide repeat protein [Bacteroidota bacterium]
MNEHYYNKIEEYLNGEMNAEEKELFEAALSSDKELLKVFKVYSAIETEMQEAEEFSLQEIALKNTLQELNKEYFKSEPRQEAKVVKFYSDNIFKLSASIAASIAIIIAVYFGFLQQGKNIKLLADNYFEENLQQINQTVSTSEDTLQFGIAGKNRQKDTTQDSLQMGVTAYNNQEFDAALRVFRKISTDYPENREAKKYTGLVFLNTENYDKALKEFEDLSQIKEMPNNPGLFLQAVTLMRRNNQGDKQKAKELLKQVVETNAEGSQEAAQWLKEF